MNFCSQMAREAEAELIGTASQAENWLFLEYGGEWGFDAVGENGLPPTVQSWLKKQLATLQASRLVFIKRDRAVDRPNFYLAVTKERDQRLYHWQLDHYEALCALDLSAVVAGSADYTPTTHPLLLVCTNGKRDLCCSKFGLPLYQQLTSNLATTSETCAVWQATHLGGHRYAPVLALFPAGLFYGFVTPDQLPELLGTISAQMIWPKGYRGRTFYSGQVNAADFFVRQATDAWGWSAWADVDSCADEVFFRPIADPSFALLVQLETSHQAVLVSCAGKIGNEPLYRLIAITTVV